MRGTALPARPDGAQLLLLAPLKLTACCVEYRLRACVCVCVCESRRSLAWHHLTSREQRMFMAASSLTRYLNT